MATVPSSPRTRSAGTASPQAPDQLAGSGDVIAQLVRQVDLLTRRVEHLEEELAGMGKYIETDRLVVTAPNGVIEVGALGQGAGTGVWVHGRGLCSGLSAEMLVDDSTHTTNLAPEARMAASSSAGLVVARDPESPIRAPDLTVAVGAEYAVQLTARHAGFGEGVDLDGGWRGAVLVADDVTDRGMASIEANLLDDVARTVWSGTRWERTEEAR